MRTSLENAVLATIRQSHMLAAGDRVGVAVSGGADSVALLRVLENLRAHLGVTLLVVHFNHCLRGAESDADAVFVSNLASASGFEFVQDREDVASAARKHGWNLEEAARRLRYAFFERVVSEGRATRIAVAHTADDQAETVLAHIIRGTGPTGLAAIYPVAGSVVRPLLEVRRTELRSFLTARGETWREDPTNQDVSRMRARIRRQLLPILEQDFSQTIVEHLGNLARFAREEETFWHALTEDLFRKHAKNLDATWTISIRDLLAPSMLRESEEEAEPGELIPSLRPLTERIVRRLYEAVRGSRRELSARHVEQVIRLVTQSTSGRHLELPGGILAERNFDQLIFCAKEATGLSLARAETAAHPPAYHYVVELPERGAATVSVPELGRCFHLKVVDWPLAERETKRDTEALDAHLLRAPLILRSWQPGDAYRPHGRRHTRKLKQMFAARRVPSRQRAGWPVLESGGRIVWSRGMPPADEACARAGTRLGVVIEEDCL
ncbi:MAG TPA: tRNA lysidine(34) synthetase TilS [Candidatus Limnocylindrales bacterium]|nr:tRNA lysidine(34) synthetase TilS [Candidatus Limnocylindrales bacterium]